MFPRVDYTREMFAGSRALTFQSADIIGYGKADGLPRFEVDDSAMDLKIPLAQLSQLGHHKYRLGHLIDHPKLFAAYPELRWTKVKLHCNFEEEGGGFLRHGGEIKYAYPPTIEKAAALRCLAHEIQHNVQLLEGFAPGSAHEAALVNVFVRATRRLENRIARTGDQRLRSKCIALSDAARLFEEGGADRAKGEIAEALTQIQRRTFRAYMNCPGEIEARAVSARLHLSSQERQNMAVTHLQSSPYNAPPTSPTDIYDESAILRMFNRHRVLILAMERAKASLHHFFKPPAFS